MPVRDIKQAMALVNKYRVSDPLLIQKLYDIAMPKFFDKAGKTGQMQTRLLVGLFYLLAKSPLN